MLEICASSVNSIDIIKSFVSVIIDWQELLSNVERMEHFIAEEVALILIAYVINHRPGVIVISVGPI